MGVSNHDRPSGVRGPAPQGDFKKYRVSKIAFSAFREHLFAAIFNEIISFHALLN